MYIYIYIYIYTCVSNDHYPTAAPFRPSHCQAGRRREDLYIDIYIYIYISTSIHILKYINIPACRTTIYRQQRLFVPLTAKRVGGGKIYISTTIYIYIYIHVYSYLEIYK